MAAKTTGGLGKGLDLLFGETDKAEVENGSAINVDIGKIEPNREQPRKQFEEESLFALTESIRQHGVITPLTVRKIGGERYQIIAGERRYKAARQAGLDKLPVLVLEADEEKAMVLAMIENLQREDLTPIEEAEGYRVLTDMYGMTQEMAAERVGKSRSAVANTMRLTELESEVKAFVNSEELSAGHARALLPLSRKDQLKAANTVILKGLTVRQTEALVKKIKENPAEDIAGINVDYGKELGRQLSDTLGRGVKIVSNKKNRGKIILEYYDLDDLDNLVDYLKKGTGKEGNPYESGGK